MADTRGRLETRGLVIRRFTADDWAEIQKLAYDKEASPGGKFDHRWPTDEAGCRGAAGYFATNETFWAVCLKDGRRLIGLLALSNEGEPGVMEIGHVFHTDFVGGGLDTEALGCMMDHAFVDLGAQRVIARNAEAWTVQLAPLHKLGMTVVERSDGTSFLQRDAKGGPITFVACTMAITSDEWLRRRGART